MRTILKNGILIVCILVMTFQFSTGFKDMIKLVEDNDPYIKVDNMGQINYLDSYVNYNSNDETYVKVDTLRILLYKIFQNILLLFGIFMGLIFLSNNNKDFSLIDTFKEAKIE